MNAWKMDAGAVRAALESTHIAKLSQAARNVGISFRSGSLDKAGIVEAIWRAGKGRHALQFVHQLEGHAAEPGTSVQGQDAPQTPSPGQVATSVPAPTPMPQAPSQTIPSVLTPNLVEAVRLAIAGQAEPLQAGILGIAQSAAQPSSLDHDAVRGLVREETADSIMHLDRQTQAIGERVRVLESMPRGTVVNLPDKPKAYESDERAHYQFPRLLARLHLGLNVYLCGPAGSGKTHAASMAAKALGKHFYAMGAVNYEHSLMGYMDANGKYVRTPFRDAYEKGGLILLDEFDASSAEAPLAVNAALANGFAGFPDGMIPRHPDFLCVIGANTDGSGATMQFAGRARLDGAFLDRFVQIAWQYDAAIERDKAQGENDWLAAVHSIRAFMLERQIQDVGATLRAVDFGARMLRAGIPRGEVLEDTCKRGTLATQWAEITRLGPVAEFLAGF